jgi:hypothetical protein
MNQIKAVTLLFYFFRCVCPAFSQGAGDAGVCQVHSLKSAEWNDTTGKIKNQAKFGFSYGMAGKKVSVYNLYRDYNRSLTDRISTTLKMSYAIRHGEIGTTRGLSDAILTVNYELTDNLKVVTGLKLPFNKSEISKDGATLPMAYQVSLGTCDLILGGAWTKNNFNFAVAWQQPLVQNNNNFKAEDLSDELNTRGYTSTNGFERSGDIIMRLNYVAKILNGRFKIIPGLLPVYHLANDRMETENGNKVEIIGSRGLTLNISSLLRFHLSEKAYFEISGGMPVVHRAITPEGLGDFSVGVEFVTNFGRICKSKHTQIY